MIKKTIAIELETGLEARPVAMLVQVASQYDSNNLCGVWNQES